MTVFHTEVKPIRGNASVPVVYAVERAVRILGAFTVERPTLSLGEIAHHVGLSKSTVRRLLLTLQHTGLVASDPASTHYRLGIRCLELGAAAQAATDLRQCALPVMRRLVQEVGETAYLLVPRGAEAICLEIAEARRGVRVLFAEVGTAFPLHAGAAPRALLAAAPDGVVRDLLTRPLRRYTPDTIADAATLERDIQTTRARGYSISVDDLVEGVAGIGALIWDRRVDAVAAISISGIKNRLLGAEQERLTRAVVEAAHEISRAIGCPPDRLPAGPWPPALRPDAPQH
ncbi:MAG: IclR family transcriptional regulator [Candidatus Rokubacteria bacterium]|nr:IclR family transcriptional regulator [Candidatus Rokubacteria bacterium]